MYPMLASPFHAVRAGRRTDTRSLVSLRAWLSPSHVNAPVPGQSVADPHTARGRVPTGTIAKIWLWERGSHDGKEGHLLAGQQRQAADWRHHSPAPAVGDGAYVQGATEHDSATEQQPAGPVAGGTLASERVWQHPQHHRVRQLVANCSVERGLLPGAGQPLLECVSAARTQSHGQEAERRAGGPGLRAGDPLHKFA